MENIGEKLYQLRKKSGLSQEQLGYEVGVSRQTISKWEQGAMQPNLENIQLLSSVLKVDITYFLSNNYENKVADKEIAVTKQVDLSKKNIINLLFGIMFAVLFLGALIYTVIVGLTALTNNVGYMTSNNVNIDLWLFIIVLFITILLLIFSLIFIFRFIKYRKK